MAIGGTGFFFGWVQFSVPPGSYGVISSKTHGVDQNLVKSGEFRWVWYKLIPTNVKITVFRLEQKKIDINYSGSLPSGDIYAAFAGPAFTGLLANFSWDIKAAVSFILKPDTLVPLVERLNLTDQEMLDNYLLDIVRGMEVIILRSLTSTETDSVRLENLLSGRQDFEIEREILGTFPEIQDFSLTIKSAKFPDFILYKQVRLLYEDFLSKQREYVSSTFSNKAEGHIESMLRFDELEHYGELLTKYPVLLDYLSLEKKKNE